MDKSTFEQSAIFLSVNLGGINYDINFYKTFNKNVLTYFVNAPLLSDTQNLYGDTEAYANNDIRFGLFSIAIVKLATILNVDVLHLNDWHTALAAFWIRQENPKIKTIFTIHNLAYQGVFSEDSLQRLGIDKKYFTMDSLEFYGRCNFMKAGIKYSDKIATVSPNYAKEILTPAFGCGLDGFLIHHKEKLSGILNGIDTKVFNAKIDSSLFRNFDVNSLELKFENKKALLKKTKLKNAKLPLFVMISRLAEQKGFDILIDSLELLLKQELNLLLSVDGGSPFKKTLMNASKLHNNFEIFFGYNEELSHQIYASADFLLMPSLFEPCGLNQMISFRYGTIPIVHDTGGLHDSVFEKTKKCGLGISFSKPTKRAFFQAVIRALKLYKKRKQMIDMQKFNMGCDFSFEKSALKYINLYNEILL